MTASELASRRLTYGPPGATRPAGEHWVPPDGFRRYERTVPVGAGDAVWQAATTTLMSWGVKTRSGFRVEPATTVGEGLDYWLVAEAGPIRIREPARVVAVVDRPDRCGFAYGTLDGHPVSGEEAFVLHRDGDDTVFLTLRSLTRPGRGRWRLAFPAVLVAQRRYRARYLRALRAGT